jgi:hypothetical protein
VLVWLDQIIPSVLEDAFQKYLDKHVFPINVKHIESEEEKPEDRVNEIDG